MTLEVPYTPPRFNADGFNCPFCGAFSHQEWARPSYAIGLTRYDGLDSFKISRCPRCKNFAVWIREAMVYPDLLTAPRPNPDLSPDIKRDYLEARAILTKSPRGAAALLRLAIQKLCEELGEKGHDINTDIASLVKKGLPAKVQQALDTVRVVGNNAVHPGQIDLRDNNEVAEQLFGLVNLISDVMITQPKHVEALYTSVVPEKLKKAIETRDESA